MHPDMERRLRELLHAFFNDTKVDERGLILLDGNWTSFDHLATFLSRNFTNEVGDSSHVYVYMVLQEHLRSDLFVGRAGGIISAVLTKEEVGKLEDGFVDWWRHVPRQYEYRFPLPGVSGLELPIRLGVNAVIRNESWNTSEVDRRTNRGLGLFGALSIAGGLGQPAPMREIPTLCVTSRGLALRNISNESATHSAISTAKVALQLAYATGLLSRSVTTEVGDCENGKYRELVEESPSRDVKLPEGFRQALRFTVAGNDKKAESFGDVIGLLARAMDWGGRSTLAVRSIRKVLDRYGSGKGGTTRPDSARDHVDRIVTAAIWAFDAHSDEPNANRVVRVAIAFEALYGGGSKDPVIATLSNRISYALGRSLEGRTDIKQKFEAFYEMRSKVVHRGELRLGHEQRECLAWAEGIVAKALSAEVDLLSDSEQTLAEEKAAHAKAENGPA